MLTIYTCRDVRQGEELTFAYFGPKDDEEEEKEEEVEVDEHGQQKVKVVCFFFYITSQKTTLTLLIRWEDLRVTKTKQSIDLACVGLPTVAGKCFNFKLIVAVPAYGCVVYSLCYHFPWPPILNVTFACITPFYARIPYQELLCNYENVKVRFTVTENPDFVYEPDCLLAIHCSQVLHLPALLEFFPITSLCFKCDLSLVSWMTTNILVATFFCLPHTMASSIVVIA